MKKMKKMKKMEKTKKTKERKKTKKMKMKKNETVIWLKRLSCDKCYLVIKYIL